MHRVFSRSLYRILQFLRGEPVFRVLREIEKSQWLPIEDLKRIQWEKLNRLVSFVYREIPFYKNKFNSLGIKPQDIRTLEDFGRLPLLTKKEIQENAAMLYPLVKNDKFTNAKTSGSTGSPLSVRMSQLSWAYHHANIMRAMRWHGLDYFSKEVRIGSQSIEPKKRLGSKLKNAICNRVFIPANNLSDEHLSKYLKKIYRFKPEFLYGYPTALFQLAKFIFNISHDQAKLKIKFVVSHGEELEDYQRDFIQKTFGCRVINGYGAGEVGIISYECPVGNMHIPIESIYLETIKPNEDYEGGYQEIVVTDLHNYSMPLLRYRIGDLGFLSEFKCPCGRSLPVLSGLKGKIRDIIETTNGRKVHTVIFNDIFKDLISRGGKVYEWQVIQKGLLNFNVNIIKGDNFTDSHLVFLKNLFHTYLGSDAKINFNFVKEIERHPSGKFRAFIRE
jgi:phenylacetate-CoA ligase